MTAAINFSPRARNAGPPRWRALLGALAMLICAATAGPIARAQTGMFDQSICKDPGGGWECSDGAAAYNRQPARVCRKRRPNPNCQRQFSEVMGPIPDGWSLWSPSCHESVMSAEIYCFRGCMEVETHNNYVVEIDPMHGKMCTWPDPDRYRPTYRCKNIGSNERHVATDGLRESIQAAVGKRVGEACGYAVKTLEFASSPPPGDTREPYCNPDDPYAKPGPDGMVAGRCLRLPAAPPSPTPPPPAPPGGGGPPTSGPPTGRPPTGGPPTGGPPVEGGPTPDCGYLCQSLAISLCAPDGLYPNMDSTQCRIAFVQACYPVCRTAVAVGGAGAGHAGVCNVWWTVCQNLGNRVGHNSTMVKKCMADYLTYCSGY